MSKCKVHEISDQTDILRKMRTRVMLSLKANLHFGFAIHDHGRLLRIPWQYRESSLAALAFDRAVGRSLSDVEWRRNEGYCMAHRSSG